MISLPLFFVSYLIQFEALSNQQYLYNAILRSIELFALIVCICSVLVAVGPISHRHTTCDSVMRKYAIDFALTFASIALFCIVELPLLVVTRQKLLDAVASNTISMRGYVVLAFGLVLVCTALDCFVLTLVADVTSLLARWWKSHQRSKRSARQKIYTASRHASGTEPIEIGRASCRERV